MAYVDVNAKSINTKTGNKRLSEETDIPKAINTAIKILQIPEKHREDARQEGFLAFAAGDSVLNHLRDWWREELRYQKHFKTNKDFDKFTILDKPEGCSFLVPRYE